MYIENLGVGKTAVKRAEKKIYKNRGKNYTLSCLANIFKSLIHFKENQTGGARVA